MTCALLCGLALESVEARFGATDSLAALANGQMALTVSERGDVTALRWPSTGRFDQLHYVTRPPPADGLPALPRAGAQPDMGLFVGLRFEQDGQAWVEWPHQGEGWSSEVSYLSDTSRVVRVEYRLDDDALVLIEEYWLAPDRPLLLLQLELQTEGARRIPAGLVLYENLAPCDQHIPGQPVADWLYDAQGSDHPNDFALLYSAQADALLHFRPRDSEALGQLWAPAMAAIGTDAAGQAAADALLQELIQEPREGTYLALGADLPSLAHQVGRVDPTDLARPRDAYLDAADGTLTGQPAVLGSASGALLWSWPTSSSVVTVFVAAGSLAGEALALIENARLYGFATYSEQALRTDGELDRAMAMPDTQDLAVRQVARRAIRAVATAQSAGSGALVAALAGQPPLALDCPAYSAWMREALDQAGLYGQASAHGVFLAQAQQRAGSSAASGRWWTCHDSLGEPAAGLPSAIDASALAAWSMARHVQVLRDARHDDEARSYLERVATSLLLAGDDLDGCRDAATGLTCAAVEDEDAVARQSVRATALSVAALEQIATALSWRDASDARVERYRESARSLRLAARQHFVDAAGILQGSPVERALALYLGRLLEAGAVHDAAVDALLLEVESELALQQATVQDLPLRVWILAELCRDDKARRLRLAPLLEQLIALADPRSAQYGGLLRRVDDDGDGQPDRLQPQVATPFLPAGALVYLATVAFHGRQPPPSSVGPIDTCGCTTLAAGPAGLGVVVLLTLTLYRRRGTRRAPAQGASR